MLDLNLHHDHDPFLSPNLHSSSSSSSLSNPIFFMNPSHHQPLGPGLGASSDFSMDQQEIFKLEPVWDHNHESAVDVSDKGLKFKIRRREDSKEYETEKNNISSKWMSSKMRIMRKMISSDKSTVVDPKLEQDDQLKLQPSSPVETDNSSNSSSNNSARVCADCNTTKTPLWRSGPRGPKTLCNACGIRQRKARRAAAAAANGTSVAAPPPVKKKKRSSASGAPQLNKRCKIITSSASSRNKICFEDLMMSLSKSSAFQQVFPQDDKEAAILLMALSYGMVHG